ncbi:MAG: bifunctional lytic transglycosylase/C40 family peptidase [Rhodococcus fascians]|uniref:C40 family peptidase n=1 Tax=Rhodococcoides fascians TaxID=1828 RepID=UPI000375D9C4|nr:MULTISPECIES: bifunctional lytic transglycosylase/C40 family peptidase [Rhodococcus]OZC57317.1 lytic transglycosylase [Rhodococcus sp. 06-621-2]OZD65565.1 lytic transglycosylase [Rhodococcus sp. 06-1059B-a]OZE80705.1 lytic transglycosylase [Rhodococcus sp. 15-649-1-2]OZF03795.1 lytic transglycosylase [Rhodococcus sp. 15-1154-1]
MAGDPIAVIVAVIVSAAGAAAGTDLPPPIQDGAAGVAESAENAAPGLQQQLDDLLGALPDDQRDDASAMLDDAAAAIESAADPMLPDEPDTEKTEETEPADGGAATDAPPTPPLAQVPVASVTSSPITSLGALIPSASGALQFGTSTYSLGDLVSQTAFMPAAEALRRALFPGVPATFTGVSASPIGAITAFVPWLMKAGAICDGVGAPVIAALYAAENGFRHGPTAPVSSSGARGPGQFMPGTWATYGKDADGDGVADINGIADSVMASGNMLCDIHSQVSQWKSEGRVSGDTLDLTIAGYNAGAGAVLRSGGMPSGTPDYENQTKPYVAKIRATEMQFSAILNPFSALDIAGAGANAVRSAMNYLGLPYVWGGGNINGPSGGGFDCSGLTSYAIFKASGGKVTLPRTSETQWNVGTEIPLGLAQPGDLLFGNWQAGGPGHVAIYVGNGQMVHAPTFGDVVKIGPVFDGMKARRVL